MCPEYGATVAIFPIDDMTLDYLRLTGRDEARGAARRGVRQGAGPLPHQRQPRRRLLEDDRAGPRLDRAEPRRTEASAGPGVARRAPSRRSRPRCRRMQVPAKGRAGRRAAATAVAVADPRVETLDHGAVVIAAITSCTNTSNPSVMIGAGLRGEEGGGEGPHAQAVGEEQPRARLEGGDRVSQRRRPDAVSRSARLQSRGLRLHDLHRQQRTAARGSRCRRFARRTSWCARC